MKTIKDTDFFETLKHSSNYISAHIATIALSFISIPVFTRLFTRADYGIFSIFNIYVMIMTVILTLNSHTAVSRYYYEKTDDFDAFVGSTFIFVGPIFTATVVIVMLFYKQITSLIYLPKMLPVYLLFACLFNIIYSIYNQILIPQKRSREVANISILKGYAGFGISVLFVYMLKENRYLGKIWGILLIDSIFSVYFIIMMSQFLKFSFKIRHIKYIIIYSFPLIAYELGSIILLQLDTIMINKMIDASAAGLYSLGYNIAIPLIFVIDSTQRALIPDFFILYKKKEYNRLNVLTKQIFSVVLTVALAAIIFIKEILMILADRKFYPSLGIVPIVIIGFIFYGMTTVYNRYILYDKKTFYLSVTVLLSAVLNILLNMIYIPRYGYIAAAYTTVASYFFMFFITWMVVKIILRKETTPLLMIWEPFLIMLFFIGVVYFISLLKLNSILFLSIKFIVLAAFCLIVFHREIKGIFK